MNVQVYLVKMEELVLILLMDTNVIACLVTLEITVKLVKTKFIAIIYIFIFK